MVKTNNSGESGSPYFSPLLPLNNSPYYPLKLMLNRTEAMHLMTHCVNRGGNLTALRSSLIKSQWIESKAL